MKRGSFKNRHFCIMTQGVLIQALSGDACDCTRTPEFIMACDQSHALYAFRSHRNLLKYNVYEESPSVEITRLERQKSKSEGLFVEITSLER